MTNLINIYFFFLFVGISVRDYIVLPSRSRISITFEGDLGVEGFFGIKRLWYKITYN